MRYVLQYKGRLHARSLRLLSIESNNTITELLNHTPASSPARALVERALEGATRIAAKCDRAQDNGYDRMTTSTFPIPFLL
ncbi:hypothetical protein OE88DRAFT_1650286 [Heliocybe sulcata]|uniref:Uncharacterized protein n=1 Tax=Heliocybe sulcata TaxID=5364 RepID=A0A5C3NSV8_9AGAM|nr:hypothetical protein OE88DRAFT_1650286 [Heliocybe sulcata]